MAHDQLTLRLSPEAAKALDAACAAVGSIVPRHRLAVLALVRGAQELAINPALILGAPTAAAVVQPPPVEAAAPSSAQTSTPAERARKRWGSVSAQDFEALARDLEAAREGGTLAAMLRASGAPTGNVYAWMKARRAGEAGGMSAETYQKLRAAIDAASKGGGSE